MVTSTFYALISIKTADGFENFARFNLGNSRKTATAIFEQLKGNPDVNRKTLLTMELMETVNGLPVNLHMLDCTLDDVAYNCKVITKETFKLHNLKAAF